MPKNTKANHKRQVLSSQDALSEILRSGAQRLIAQAIETDVEKMLADYQDMTSITCHRAVVCNGFLLER